MKKYSYALQQFIMVEVTDGYAIQNAMSFTVLKDKNMMSFFKMLDDENRLIVSRELIERYFGDEIDEAILFLTNSNELGYIFFDKEGSELLFTNLSLKAGRKFTIITTNISFERWDEIFHNPAMTTAMIDRLTHKAFIDNMNGNSYRYKETEKWLKEQYFFIALSGVFFN